MNAPQPSLPGRFPVAAARRQADALHGADAHPRAPRQTPDPAPWGTNPPAGVVEVGQRQEFPMHPVSSGDSRLRADRHHLVHDDTNEEAAKAPHRTTAGS